MVTGATAPGDSTELAADSRLGGAPVNGSEEVALQLRPYNQRIELPGVDDHSDREMGNLGAGVGGVASGTVTSGEDDGLNDIDEDELTREKVKKAASQVRNGSTKNHTIDRMEFHDVTKTLGIRFPGIYRREVGAEGSVPLPLPPSPSIFVSLR